MVRSYPARPARAMRPRSNGRERGEPLSSGRVSEHDVPPAQYASVIREMIRHENDLTNHRIMWLLIVQGFLANAYFLGAQQSRTTQAVIQFTAVLVTFSNFSTLYRSYHARKYLRFLGAEAKQGRLPEEFLPLTGWPDRRLAGWKRGWLCPWLEGADDFQEPYFFLPVLFVYVWLLAWLQPRLGMRPGYSMLAAAFLSAILVVLAFAGFAVVWVRRRESRSDTAATDS